MATNGQTQDVFSRTLATAGSRNVPPAIKSRRPVSHSEMSDSEPVGKAAGRRSQKDRAS